MRQAISLLVQRWALNAPALLKRTPEDLGITRETGFPVDYTLPQAAGGLLPPMEVFNQMWGEFSTVIWEINRHGCGLPYDDGIDYILPCLVTGTDNVYYEAVQENGPGSTIQDPVTDSSNTYWNRLVRNPDAATETEAGIIEIASNSETDAGTDNQRAITPAKLQRKINSLINGAPSNRNTLKELNDAIESIDTSGAPNADETTRGVIEIASNSETDAGTDNQRAITPAKLHRRTPNSSATTRGLIEIADTNEVDTGTDNTRAVPPVQLKRITDDIYDALAPLDDPILTGNPRGVTRARNNNSISLATTAYVERAIADLIDGSPLTLDTLNEIAAAIDDDPDFHTTISNMITNAISNLNLDVALPSISNMSGNVRTLIDIMLTGASGAFWPFDYEVTNLPAGLTFDADTRRVYGRPTTQGNSTVTYSVTDNQNNMASQSFSWNIGAALEIGILWFVDNTTDFARSWEESTRTRNTSYDIGLTSSANNAAVSDDITTWFVESQTARAYVTKTRARDNAKDISIGTDVAGAVYDGTYILFVINQSNSARAYRASDRTRIDAADLSLGSGTWVGALTDGTTIWFIDDGANYARAWTISSRSRNIDKDINLGTGTWFGGMSNGTILWFIDQATDIAVAYNASDMMRNTGFDIDLGSANWSAGTFGYTNV